MEFESKTPAGQQHQSQNEQFIRRKEDEEEESTDKISSSKTGIQRKPQPADNNQPRAITQSNIRSMAVNQGDASQPLAMNNPALQVQQRLQGKGESMGGETKSRMENALGADLTGVKLHTGGEGNEIAKAHNAKALTVGQDIAFASGEYKPGTMEGDALLLHESHHTLQQKGASNDPETMKKETQPQANENVYEQEADNAAVAGTAKLWGKSDSWIGKMAGKTKNVMKAGLGLQRCGGSPSADKKTAIDTLRKDTLKKDTLAPKILDPNAKKTVLTDLQKKQFIATVMAESSQGNDQAFKIAWIYLNNIVSHGFEGGMSNSSAYSGKNFWFKAWMVAQGETDYRKKPLPSNLANRESMKVIDPKSLQKRKALNVGDYVDNNGYFQGQISSRLPVVKNHIENTVLGHPEYNPYVGWEGQGYYGDLNQSTPAAKADIGWKQARQYFWLQKDGTIPKDQFYVEELRAKGQTTQFLFNRSKIEAYFKTHKLPDVVPLYDEDTGEKMK